MANSELRNCRSFKNGGSSGQALLEYVLLLTLVLIIALSTLYQFNSAFRNYLDSYFGDYIACLLETGELPSSGGQVSQGGVCDSLYRPFDLASGRPAISTGPGSSGGSNDGNSGADSGGAGNNEDLRPDSASMASADSGGGSGSSGLDGDFASGAGRRGSNRAALDGDPDDDTYTGSDAVSSAGSIGGSDMDAGGGYQDRVLLPGNFALEEEQEQSRAGRPLRVDVENIEEDGLRPGRVNVEEKLEKTASADDDEPLTFGGFIRLLLIAAIIIALFLLLGGQFLQISKNMDSSG